MLTVVEKVLFLQDVDFFEYASTEDLAYVAAITEEVRMERGTTIYNEGEMPDSMYIVVDGKVRLHRGDDDVMIAQRKGVFGSWALFDDEPMVVTATTLDDSHLLKIDKEDFFDVLADHVEIAQGILKAIVKRLRSLMGRVGGGGQPRT